MHVLYGTQTCPDICLTILKLYKKGIKMYFPGLGYAEILRCVNLAGYVECKTGQHLSKIF